MIARPLWRDEWVKLIYKHPTLGSRLRLFCVGLASHVTDDGRRCMTPGGQVSVGRSELAIKFGVSEKAVTKLFEDAITVGALERLLPGKKGRTAVYMARLPDSVAERPRRRGQWSADQVELAALRAAQLDSPHVGTESGGAKGGPRPRQLDSPHVGTESGELATLNRSPHVVPTSSTSATSQTSPATSVDEPQRSARAQTAQAGKRTSTPDTSAVPSSDPADRVRDACPVPIVDVPSDGKVALAPPRQPILETDDVQHAHDVLERLGPERYERALLQAAQADESLTGSALIVAAAQLVRGAA